MDSHAGTTQLNGCAKPRVQAEATWECWIMPGVTSHFEARWTVPQLLPGSLQSPVAGPSQRDVLSVWPASIVRRVYRFRLRSLPPWYVNPARPAGRLGATSPVWPVNPRLANKEPDSRGHSGNIWLNPEKICLDPGAERAVLL